MSDTTTRVRAKRTSFLDRTWLDHWTVLALTPIEPPSVDDLRTKMVEFMEQNPDHPLSCTLAEDGRSWRPVAPAKRAAHVAGVIMAGAAVDGAADDYHGVLDEQRPGAESSAPYKVVVGQESILMYFAHVAGDAVVFSPFGVLMALGDVDGLRSLRPDAGLPTAIKIFSKEVRAHWREWWSYMRSPANQLPQPVSVAAEPVADATTSVGVELSAEGHKAFRAWRKANCPELSAAALMASATYLAFAAEGLPIDRDGFYTLVDLRRHLPKNQATRPGNLAKSLLVPTDLADPKRVGADMKSLVESARGVPSLLSGAISEVLSRGKNHAAPTGAGTVRMTFNSMMRNPGIEHIPWTDPAKARYLGMSYPVGANGMSVFACGIEGKVDFSASFNPNVLDRDAVRRALVRLRDMPALLEAALPAIAEEPTTLAPARTG